MLTEDLYSAISNIANSIDALLDSHEQETSSTVASLCDSIDKLCKTVSDGKSVEGAETILGLIAGALSGETGKVEEGAAALTKSIKGVADSLNEISGVSDNIVSTTKDISTSMQALSEGIESVGVRTLFSAYITKATFPAIHAFTVRSVELFASIAEKSGDLKKSQEGISALKDSIEDIAAAAGWTVLGGVAAVAGTLALVPLSLFVITSSALFSLTRKLFDSKGSKGTADAISSMAKGIIYMAEAAFVVTIASPFFILGTGALIPASIFTVAVAGLNLLVTKLFGDKKAQDNSAIKSMAKGILYMSLAAMAAIVAAPVALLAIPCVLVLGLFTLAVGALVVKPINSLVNSKGFKNFKKGVLSMSLGILALGLTALATVVLTPVFLLGSVGMLATGLFVKVSGQVFKSAAKNTKNYIKGTLGLVIMSAGFLATSYLLVQTVKVGKDLLSWDTLGVLGVLTAVTIGGTAMMKLAGKAMGSVIKGAVAVLLVAGTVYGAAYLFNQAVTECKELIANPETTIEGLLALCASVGVMGTAIAAAGFALPFITPGAVAVALVSSTVYAAAKAIGEASDAWAKSQGSGAFEIDSDGNTPFSSTVKGVISSMREAISDIDDIDEVGDAIKALMPVCDFVQKLAVGVSEFSKIALMKGEIADAKGNKMPFNLSKVGEGIGAVVGSVVTGIGDALKTFSFDDKDMVEVSTGGFLGIGATKTKIPKQIAAIRHLIPLATFVGALASGVSEFSKIATMQGTMSVYDAEQKKMVQRPFNLQDVGAGISSIIVSLMDGLNQGISALEEGGMSEITTGGFLGFGGDKITVPTRLLSLQHIMPLAAFISACAEMISALGKDKDGNALTVDTRVIGGVFTGLVDALNVDDIDDILENAGEGLEDLVEPLAAFCGAKWSNLPNTESTQNFKNLIWTFTGLNDRDLGSMERGGRALDTVADALGCSSFTNNIGSVADGLERSVDAINDVDVRKANAIANVYEQMAKAASKRSRDIQEVVNAIKESTAAITGAVDRIDVGRSSSNSSSSGSFGGLSSNSTSRSEQAKAKEIKPTEPVLTAAPKQKVTVDLTINGYGGDTWIIKRR